MARQHTYTLTLQWTGNTGQGTADYRSYKRDYEISADGKPVLAGSADPDYLGDAGRWNPEELLVAALSACHKLWFLHLCASANITVTGYVDAPLGTMNTNDDGSGQFSSVLLRPTIALADAAQATRADALHAKAHDMCFIARSVNFPVSVEANYR